jgi:hypothetical protein
MTLRDVSKPLTPCLVPREEGTEVLHDLPHRYLIWLS